MFCVEDSLFRDSLHHTYYIENSTRCYQAWKEIPLESIEKNAHTLDFYNPFDFFCLDV